LCEIIFIGMEIETPGLLVAESLKKPVQNTYGFILFMPCSE